MLQSFTLLLISSQRFRLLREQAWKQPVGAWLDGIHRVVDAARPEDVQELVVFVPQGLKARDVIAQAEGLGTRAPKYPPAL
jgi:hypothetical protein